MGQIANFVHRTARSECGFGFAQMMIILPIILIIMGSAATYFYEKLLTNVQERARDNFQIHQQNMITDLENPAVWDETLRLDTGVHCLADASCKTREHREIQIAGVDGKLLSGATSAGYTIDGAACSPRVVDEDPCPIRWEFSWRPLCPDLATCPADTEVEILGQLVDGGLLKSRLNLDRYKVVLYRKLF